MRKPAIPLLTVIALAAAGLALSACQKKQPSPGQQMKQGAQQIGQGVEHAASDAGQAVSDSAITTKVKSRLAANQGLSSFDIHVETTNGVVTLTGTVNQVSARDLAGRIASDTDGVKGVNNNIRVVMGN